MKTTGLILFAVIILTGIAVKAQPCTPQGDEVSYGISDTWIGYVYDNTGFTTYQGYINEGNAGNPTFNQSFGGSNVSYPTNGCATNTETFSVRYKLRKTFTSGNYEFIAGGDDGYRLSIDGGITWIINRWFDQGYNTTSYITLLNGTYDLVLEYYENTGGNQVSFLVQSFCSGTGNPAVYGTNDIWQGYVYDGVNFSSYKGDVTEGIAGNPNFDENFGGSNLNYNTNACPVQTETFSVRYRLRKTFANGSYIFVLGGDDGYRFSIDGGATWVINRWWDQSYNTSSYTANLNGTYDLVIEYYESGGDNRISFDMNGTLLPVRLLQFNGNLRNNQAELQWKIAAGSNPDYFEIEYSSNGQHFKKIARIGRNTNSGNTFNYSDNQASQRISYYRLRILDLDGKQTYSPIITLSNNHSTEVRIYPTIVENKLVYIQSGKALNNVSVYVFDMTGKKIDSQFFQSIAGGQTALLYLPNRISAGTYFLEINANDRQQGKKLLIIQ